jgi:hypothetical protein
LFRRRDPRHHDEIFVGTEAADVLDAGDGSDFLFGHGGNDILLGGSGDDYVEGRAGADFIDGGAQDGLTFGVDYAVYANSDAGVWIDLGANQAFGGHAEGDVLVNIEGIIGSDHDDVLIGRNGPGDRFWGRAGNDQFAGLGGFDQIEYDDSPTGVYVDLGAGYAEDGWGGIDTFSGIEAVRGSTFDDVLVGSDNPFVFERFRGRAGDDTIIGGAGIDEVEYTTARAGVNVNLASGIASDGEGGTDTLIGIETIRGSFFDDVLIGDDFDANRFTGLAGDDTIDGGAGANDLADYSIDVGIGGTQGITVDLTAGTAIDGFGDTDTLVGIESVVGTILADWIRGDGNANFLNGMAGNDVLLGEGGHDTFLTGQSDDFVDGGDGVDRMAYAVDPSLGGFGGVTVDLAAGSAVDGFGDIDTLVDIENV